MGYIGAAIIFTVTFATVFVIGKIAGVTIESIDKIFKLN